MARPAAGIRVVHHRLQPLEPLEPARALAAHLCRPRRLRRPAAGHADRQLRGEGASLGGWREKRGGEGDACHQAIGRSRGGRTTRIHALCDEQGRPHAILLTGGNVADITAAATLVSAVTPPRELVADKGYDANHLRRFLAERGTAAVIPSTRSRKVAIPHDAERYRLRNVIGRTFCRIKDFRGIASRYDKTARNFLSAVCLVSAITYRA
jgi:transposase